MFWLVSSLVYLSFVVLRLSFFLSFLVPPFPSMFNMYALLFYIIAFLEPSVILLLSFVFVYLSICSSLRHSFVFFCEFPVIFLIASILPIFFFFFRFLCLLNNIDLSLLY